MNERTIAFLLGGVTVFAWIVFWNGLTRAYLANHPDSTTAASVVKLT